TTTGWHLWFCGVEADSAAEICRAVRTQVIAGADFIKVFATGGDSTPGTKGLSSPYSLTEKLAPAAKARRLDKRVAAHAHSTPGVLTAIAARVTTIEHCSFWQFGGTQYDPEQGRRIADAGIYVCPTLFQGMGKLLVQHPDQPWAAAHRE